MKRVIQMLMLFAVLLATTGCANKYYEPAKKVYSAGKEIVKANSDLLDKETLNTLKQVDRAARTYDGARDKFNKK